MTNSQSVPQPARRRFLRQTALAAAAAAVWPARSWAQSAGANSDIRIAVIGLNGRGKNHIDAWNKISGVRLVALCDPDATVLARETERCKKAGRTVTGYADLRKLLADPNIDAVSIATPDHWHALAAIWGMESGKDVYVEKPVSYDIWEGRQMVAAAARHKKIVQAGTQSRSSSGIAEAVDWVRQGRLGKITVARALNYKRRPSIGKTTGPQPVPEGVDYELWTGPAALTPPRRAKFHYDWHWFWNYGTGDLGNNCVHEIDVARWFTGEAYAPHTTISVGGRFGYEDDGETPNTQFCFYDYPTAPIIAEVRGLPVKTGGEKMDQYLGGEIAVVIECEGGHVLVPNHDGGVAFDKEGKEVKRFHGPGNHFENFIRAVRSRREADLSAPIVEGHRSTALCHLGNISHRLGEWHLPGEIRERLAADRDAAPTLDRMADHLAANGVDLGKTRLTLGAAIKINPASEEIIQNKAANKLVSRAYRHGYEVKRQSMA